MQIRTKKKLLKLVWDSPFQHKTENTMKLNYYLCLNQTYKIDLVIGHNNRSIRVFIR